jgi:hypothetical protein
MKKIPIVLFVSALITGSFAQAQSFSYSYNFENLAAGEVLVPTGNLNQPDSNDNGWYGANITSTNRVTVSDAFNSPWDVGGSQSAAIVRTCAEGSGATLFHYFIEQFDRYNAPRNINVTGSLGSALTGSGYSFSFDVMTPALSTQPRFRFFGGGETHDDVALSFQMRYNGTLRINGVDVPAFTGVFAAHTWYRFKVSNLDVSARSWDLEIFEWNGSSETSIYRATALDFDNPVSIIDRFQVRSNSTNTNPIYFDNFIAVR